MTDTVVVGIDDSEGARAALAWAARHASSTGCRLRVVYAYELDLAWIDDYNAAIPQWEQHAQEVAHATLSRVAEEVLDALWCRYPTTHSRLPARRKAGAEAPHDCNISSVRRESLSMKMSFGCEVRHEPEHQMLGHTVRVGLEEGLCPICPGQQLEGAASGGLEWASCPCCGTQWRLEDEGFAMRPGRIIEEWS